MEKLAQDIQNLLGMTITPKQLAAFECYQQQLMEWNARMNLTAIRDEEGIRVKHFLDSLSCLQAMGENPPKRLIDVGTGGGFPGIPLKILMPGMQLTLVESVGKKVQFCQHVVDTLKLENVLVVQSRAEEVGQSKEHREQYDWAVARAVAGLPTLVEYLLPLVKVKGSILAQKGHSGPMEAHQAEKAMRLLGGHLRQLHHLTLPGVVEERYLIVVDKVAATPAKYPRRVGIPLKEPL
jgi:16S rRNA (guanine527-N7)-methyltransferase